MSPSDNCDALVGELERSCARSDAAIGASAWDTLRRLLDEQRKITHALSIAIAESGRFTDMALKSRLERVAEWRDAQSRRVSAAHDHAGARLRMLAQVKALRRSIGAPPAPASRLARLDTLQ